MRRDYGLKKTHFEFTTFIFNPTFLPRYRNFWMLVGKNKLNPVNYYNQCSHQQEQMLPYQNGNGKLGF